MSIRTPHSVALILASAFVAVVFATAFFGPLLFKDDYQTIDLSSRLIPPFALSSELHILGTDELGRDILARLVASISTSVKISFAATIISTSIGLLLGLLAVHFRGAVDHAVMAAVDLQAALPFMIIALAFLAFLDGGMVAFVTLLGLHGWERTARITRAVALEANAEGYVAAARQVGVPPLRLYRVHLLPNIASALLVTATITLPEIIILEATLSFLGLGVQPPHTSLGTMVAFGRDYLISAPWIPAFPSIVLVLLALSISSIGDWIKRRNDAYIEIE